LYGENYDECWGFISYRDKIVLDLGADYGSTAYYFLKKGAKKVIAVEGNSEYFKQLLSNYGNDDRVVCVEKWIETPEDMEQLVARFPCDIVKVDIEGAEIHIAKISPQVLSLSKKWIIETHSKLVFNTLSSFFCSLNFKIFSINYDLKGVFKILLAIQQKNVNFLR